MDELPPLFGPGQRLGRYELLDRLAVGGMAEVYLAYAKGPGDFRKVVAIKRLLPQHALDPQLLRMFLDEARLMARLAHPNVPQVTDVDDGDGKEVPYFVMEYIHGTDLRGILNAAAGPLPLEVALSIAGAVAAGLHHAHEQRGAGGQPLEIVHRDVSPSNILISFDGAVKVTDFGVAKWTEQKSFTHQGQLKGKFAHMSPEQCRGEALDRRSDVFALGTLLYEMTTGEPPFVAESEYELLRQIVSQDAPEPRREGAIYPADLATIVRQSLQRSRDDRYPHMQAMQLALEAFAREHRLVVSPLALSSYLEQLFGARVTEWREALKSGKSLAEHLDRGGGEPGSPARVPGAGTPRTQTDAFTLGAVPAARGSNRGSSVKTEGDPSLPRAAGAAPTAMGVGRILAIGAGAGLALVMLLLATELTSRWQRTSGPSLLPAPVPARAVETGSLAAEPASAPASAPAPPSVVGTRQGTPIPSPNLPSSRLGTPGSAASNSGTRLPASIALRMTGPAEGERNQRGARVARREPDAAGPGTAGSTAGDRPEEAAPVAGLTPDPGAPAGQKVPSREPPPGTARPAEGARPPAPPVKVWDPDSPVPP